MAFVKPSVGKVAPDIKNIYIYLRAVKKWGKTRTWASLVKQRFGGDITKGLLVEVANERGTTMISNLNKTHVDTYKDLVELKKWLIETRGKEHNIEWICFDVCDEIPALFEAEVCRLSTLENGKKCTIKSAFGGYNAGPEMAEKMIKKYMDDLKSNNFGLMMLGHTKMRPVKDKASTEEDTWMQLTGKLPSSYDSCFADICDTVITGNVEREFKTVGEGDKAKNYLDKEESRAYLRGTELIDAGSRFAEGTIPDYIVFENPDQFASQLIEVLTEGMRLSTEIEAAPVTKKSTKKKTPKVEEPTEEIEEVVEDTVDKAPFDVVEDIIGDIFEDEVEEEAVAPVDKNTLAEIRANFKNADDDAKSKVKTILTNYGGKLSAEMKPSDVDAIEKILGI